jgi:hypothetical protein
MLVGVGGETTGLIAPSDDMRVTDADFSEDPAIVRSTSRQAQRMIADAFKRRRFDLTGRYLLRPR